MKKRTKSELITKIKEIRKERVRLEKERWKKEIKIILQLNVIELEEMLIDFDNELYFLKEENIIQQKGSIDGTKERRQNLL